MIVIDNSPSGEVLRRTFAAKDFTIGSPIRKKLNCDALTSEYYTSKKYMAIVHYPETTTHTEYKATFLAATKKECEDYVVQKLGGVKI